ncbi:MAG: MarR family winged helix-turn-helix transcriptional regulator [Microthrixaceae bacterium]
MADSDAPHDVDAPEDLGILLLLAYQGFVRALHRELEDHGLGPLRSSDGYVIRALAGGPRRVAELARGLAVTKQAASQTVADMEDRGLLRRRPDPSDGRAALVQLTARGRRVLDVARNFHASYEEDLAERLGPRRAAALRAGLESVVAAELTPEERVELIRLP